MNRNLLPLVLLASLPALAPAQATRVGDGAGIGSYSPTRAGDGGGYTNYQAQQQALQSAANAAYGNSSPSAGPATGGPARTGGAGPGRGGALRIYSSTDRAPPALSWREQVKLARRTLVQAGTASIQAAAIGADPVEAFAALSLENDGVLTLPLDALLHAMNSSGDRQVAQGAAHLLAKRGTERAFQALVDHVANRGTVDDVAARLLFESGRPLGRDAFFTRASNARASNDADILSIRALGVFPGDDITVLLRRLAGDWSETVQAAAKEALARREALGYNTRGTFRAPHVGKDPRALAAVPGTPEYEKMQREATAYNQSHTPAQLREADRSIQEVLEQFGPDSAN